MGVGMIEKLGKIFADLVLLDIIFPIDDAQPPEDYVVQPLIMRCCIVKHMKSIVN